MGSRCYNAFMPAPYLLAPEDHTLTLAIGPVVPRGGQPVVNGLPLEGGPVEAVAGPPVLT